MLRVHELLKATQGRLIRGDKDSLALGISIDSRTINPGEAFIAIKGNNFDGHDYIYEAIKKGAGTVIVQSSKFKVQSSKGVSLILVKDTIRALGDIARYQRNKIKIPLIAVTGSNGKTTTKEMIAWLLSKKLKVLKNEGTKNNHIGLPLTLLKLKSSYDIAVVELGTNHPGELQYLAKIALPNIGVITNIGPSHLEFFSGLNGVFREKYSLIRHLLLPNIAVLNADDRLLRKEINKRIKKPFILGFGVKSRSDFFALDIKVSDRYIEFMANRKERITLNTLGAYNIYNALAALTVARIFGLAYKDIAQAFSNFDFPCGRLKLIELNNIRFIDDTYNSNPSSLKQALCTLESLKTRGRKIFVMGDMLELGERKELFHRHAGRLAARVCDSLITVGKLSKFAARQAESFGLSEKNIFACESSQEARDFLFNKISLKPEDIILVKGSRSMKMEEIFKEQ
jgi:UDP-N-acetylmuramoyl-tripeptide--D-alanyl-D-alanine ligase